MRLRDIICEDVGEEATKRGLHHIGWGRYADKSGNVVAKSVDGKLVDIPKGQKDPEIDQPDYETDRKPDAERPPEWRGWKPKASVPDDTIDQYKNKRGNVMAPLMGSSFETDFRKLPPGEVQYYEPEYSDIGKYAARNPDGYLADFSDETMASAFAAGKTLKGYDFNNDYDNSMKKLRTELKPYLDKLKKAETKAGLRNKIVNFVRDIIVAFVSPSSHRHSTSSSSDSSDSGTFGGGGGFSGGGSSGSF